MNQNLAIAVLLVGCAALCAQTPPPASSPASQSPSSSAQSQKPLPQSTANPFPDDTGNVPVLPSGSLSSLPDESAAPPVAAPTQDQDPVRSPDDASSDTIAGQNQNYSSSVSDVDNILPKPGDDTAPTGKGKKRGTSSDDDTPPPETFTEDLSVGNYYMDQHDWKGALSRFQSALVLAPDEPDVYWGLAECERHLGDFADARTYYIKVAEYDPDSRHGKDARKALKDPEIANAQKPPAPAAPQQP